MSTLSTNSAFSCDDRRLYVRASQHPPETPTRHRMLSYSALRFSFFFSFGSGCIIINYFAPLFVGGAWSSLLIRGSDG